MSKQKSFNISKYAYLEAFKKVKANKGAAGVDEQSIAEFEENLKDNLYKIWNRMSSGCYFPPEVKAVEIPKTDGGVRVLGIPTVADRTAQMVVKIYLEPSIDPWFHVDSYGYRPGKSMEQALTKTRKRCWQYDWAIDLDIKGFFDNMDHELTMKALTQHTNEKWILMYVERWLKAPMITNEGEKIERTKGTPQGGVISPLLSNLFMHYAFDKWMERNFPNNPFERYADDIIIHSKTKEEAVKLLEQVKQRMEECKLQLHPDKTKIVYCRDANRKDDDYPTDSFDFLGYTFRPRSCRNKWGKLFVNFSPAMSKKAVKSIMEEIRGWELHKWMDAKIEDIARFINPKVRGWINHYGIFNRSALFQIMSYVELKLAEWSRRKYKRLKTRLKKALRWLRRIRKGQRKKIFVHWQFNLSAKNDGAARAV